MITVRLLSNSDRSALDAFLETHRDSSMFLRSNIRHSGMTYRPEPFHAQFMGALRDSNCIGVVAHCWNGMLLLQAPEQLDELARGCIEHSGREVTGFSGPLDQVRRARTALGLDDFRAAMDEAESLYAVDLADLIVPTALGDGTVTCRAPLPEEHPLLYAWRIAYEVETLGRTDNVETRDRAAKAIDGLIAESNAWVAVVENSPVSFSAFNAALPDIVQLGGIYTPPELRGRGYAKAAVAASLLAARERGATRAVLFTSNPSAARSYEAVGFRRLGDFGLVLLK